MKKNHNARKYVRGAAAAALVLALGGAALENEGGDTKVSPAPIAERSVPLSKATQAGVIKAMEHTVQTNPGFATVMYNHLQAKPMRRGLPKGVSLSQVVRFDQNAIEDGKVTSSIWPAGVVGTPGSSANTNTTGNPRRPKHYPPKNPDPNTTPAGVPLEPATAEVGIDNGVTGPAEQGLLGTTEPAGQMNESTTPTGEADQVYSIIAGPLAVPVWRVESHKR